MFSTFSMPVPSSSSQSFIYWGEKNNTMRFNWLLWLWLSYTIWKDSMKLLLYMYSVEFPCHSKESLSIQSIIGYFSLFSMPLSFICSQMDTHIVPLSLVFFWPAGPLPNFVTSNVTPFYQVSGRRRKENKENTKMRVKREEFLMDGDSI